MRVLLLGTPGPLPFVGHVRFERVVGPLRIALVARVAAPDPETGWTRAEALRAALPAAVGDDRYALANAVVTTLRAFDAGDLTFLLLTADDRGAVLTGAGLDAVFADGAPLVPKGHPLLAPPGVPERIGFYHEDRVISTYVGVPTGQTWGGQDLEAATGARRWA